MTPCLRSIVGSALLLCLSCAAVACGDSDATDDTPGTSTGGSGGQGAKAGSAGAAGSGAKAGAGAGGSAGSSGAGGSQAGGAGASGASGQGGAGTAGASQGGAGGSSGAAGTSGAAGQGDGGSGGGGSGGDGGSGGGGSGGDGGSGGGGAAGDGGASGSAGSGAAGASAGGGAGGGQGGSSGGGQGGSAGGAASPGFPRLGAYPIGGPQSAVGTPAFIAWAAKHHVVVMTQWPGWTSNGMKMDAVMKAIKEQSKIGTRLFLYVNMGEIAKNQEQPGNAYYEKWHAADDNHWFLYENGLTSETKVDSWFDPGKYNKLNYTSFSPVVKGKNWMQWFTDFQIGYMRDGATTSGGKGDLKNPPNPYVDGFFMDNFFFRERAPDGDWNRDGKVDDHNDPTVRGWIQSAYVDYVHYVRKSWPGSLQIGNVAEWRSSTKATKEPLGVYDQLLDGGVIEGLIGESYSPETWGGFSTMLESYEWTMDGLGGPRLGMFGHNNLPQTDYASLRYGLASCLMGDGYYSPHGPDGYSPAEQLWFDEFDAPLGQALTPPTLVAWKDGVYRRDFEGGIALVNPKGNGSKKVSLGGKFKKLKGKQDPAVNDGSTVTEVTLAERDGLVLLR